MNVKRAIANYDKRGLHYPKTIKGEIFVDSGNYLMVANPHYRNPKISKIYEFDELCKTNHGYAKGVIIRAKGNPTWNRDALRTIENTFGTEYVTEHDVQDYRTNAGKDRGGEGNNSGTVDSTVQYRSRDYLDSPVTQVISSAKTSI